MHGSPHHRCIEIRAPRVASVNNRVFLLTSRDVLTASIDAPVAEESCHLRIQLFITIIMIVPRWLAIGHCIGIWQSTASVQLQGNIKLPLS